MKSFAGSLLLAAALSSLASAQTWTACNPMNGTCPPDSALGTSHTFNLTNGTAGSVWKATSGQVDYSGPSGGQFTINKKGDSPTIQSDFYIFFGEVHVVMQAAQGQGIISSIVLESDDLDEVDWEIMGTNNTASLGQPTTTVETNYFGKGNQTTYDRATYYPIDAPTSSFHNYSVVWTADKIDWLVDGALVRTLPYAAANGGHNFPQTPMNVRIGIWAGGDPDNEKGVIEWAGGATDFGNAPFTMTVASIHVSDYSTGAKQYIYTDTSGSWQSIKAVQGNSTAATTLNQPPAMSLGDKWAALSSGARSGIIAGVSALVAILLALFAFTMWKRRRAGKEEAAIAERKFDQDNLDMIQQQQQFQAAHKSVYAGGVSPASDESVAQASPLVNTRGQPVAPSSPTMGAGQFAQPQPRRPAARMSSFNNPSYNPGANAGQGGGFRGGMYNNGFGGAPAGDAQSGYTGGAQSGYTGAQSGYSGGAQSGYYGGNGAQNGYYAGAGQGAQGGHYGYSGQGDYNGHGGHYGQNNGSHFGGGRY